MWKILSTAVYLESEMQDLQVQPNTILAIDGISAVATMETESVHLILSDIPYGIGADDWDVLHNNTNSALLGTSPAQGRAAASASRARSRQ